MLTSNASLRHHPSSSQVPRLLSFNRIKILPIVSDVLDVVGAFTNHTTCDLLLNATNYIGLYDTVHEIQSCWRLRQYIINSLLPYYYRVTYMQPLTSSASILYRNTWQLTSSSLSSPNRFTQIVLEPLSSDLNAAPLLS